MSQGFKYSLIWVFMFLSLVVVWTSMKATVPAQPEKVIYSDFKKLVTEGKITEVIILQNGKLVGKRQNAQDVYTWAIPDESLPAFLDKSGVTYGSKEPEDRLWRDLLLSIVPVALLIFVFWFMMYRQMQWTGKSAMSFGKSRAKQFMEKETKTTFEDVAGCEESKRELQEIIEFLKDPKKFTKLGGKIPKGVILVGAPGTGKTLLAKAVAGEAGVPFFSISGSDFVEMFVGVGASRVRDLFEQGKKNAPCIIFIDEIDAVGRQRGAGLGGGHDEREQTLNALLVEMDGFETKEGIIIVAATNRPDVLDAALLRPGRFDRRVVVDLPDVKGRKGILEVHTKKIPMADDVDITQVAKGTPGFTGAELANLVNEAALLAARRDKEKVSMIEMEEAKDKVLMGPERKSLVLSEHDKKVTAYHEAGHAVVAYYIPGADPLHKISIIPRGRALGITQQLPEEDKYTHPKSYWLAEISVFMGGRIAEELFLKDVSIGAANDFERATTIARKMVCEWGMSESIGLISLGQKPENVFLGRDFAWHTEYSEDTARKIDTEISRLVSECYATGRKVIEAHKEALDRIAQALLKYEVLDSEQIKAVMAGEPLAEEEPQSSDPAHYRLRSIKENGRLKLTILGQELSAASNPKEVFSQDFSLAVRKAMREVHAFISGAEGRYKITIKVANPAGRQSLAEYLTARYGFPGAKIFTEASEPESDIGAACHILVELFPKHAPDSALKSLAA